MCTAHTAYLYYNVLLYSLLKALVTCASKSVAKVVHRLLAHGADPNGLNKAGENALHVECKR